MEGVSHMTSDKTARLRATVGIALVIALAVASLRWPGLQLLAILIGAGLVATAWRRLKAVNEPGYMPTKWGPKRRWELQEEIVSLARPHGQVMRERDLAAVHSAALRHRLDRALGAVSDHERKHPEAVAELLALAHWVGA